MPERDTGNRPLVSASEAAEYLGVTVETVEALASASFLSPGRVGPDGPEFRYGDLKAFLARNADSGAGNLGQSLAELGMEDADPQELLGALDVRSEEMARRAFDIFATAFPETSSWGPAERARFIEQARNRFEAILAVTGQGQLLEGSQVLAQSIRLRNPYVDPLHLAQVSLLRRWRSEPPREEAAREELLGVLLHTVNGIAAGLQTTG